MLQTFEFQTLTMDILNIKIGPVTNQQEFEAACEAIDLLIDADLIQDPVERKRPGSGVKIAYQRY